MRIRFLLSNIPVSQRNCTQASADGLPTALAGSPARTSQYHVAFQNEEEWVAKVRAAVADFRVLCNAAAIECYCLASSVATSLIFSANRLFLNTRIYNRKEDSGPMCARATCAGGHARPQQRCHTQNHDTPPHKHTHALPTDTSANSNTTTQTQRVQATVLPRALQKQLPALARD